MPYQVNQYPTPAGVACYAARTTAAQTAIDGSSTTNLVLLIDNSSGTPNPIDVTQIRANASTTVAAGLLFYLLYDGTNYRLALTLQAAAVALGASTGNGNVVSSPNADGSPLIRVMGGSKLYVGCYNASETWDHVALGKPY
jgi:hypothetical protein